MKDKILYIVLNLACWSYIATKIAYVFAESKLY